jgi:hypothetical protein
VTILVLVDSNPDEGVANHTQLGLEGLEQKMEAPRPDGKPTPLGQTAYTTEVF